MRRSWVKSYTASCGNRTKWPLGRRAPFTNNSKGSLAMIQRGARLVFPSPTFSAGRSLEAGDWTTPGLATKSLISNHVGFNMISNNWFLIHKILSLSKAVKSEKANVWYGTPTMYVDMLAHPKRNNIDFVEMRWAAYEMHWFHWN